MAEHAGTRHSVVVDGWDADRYGFVEIQQEGELGVKIRDEMEWHMIT